MSVQENSANAQNAASGTDEEYLLSVNEAQLATVLALMTGFGQGCCAVHRAPMAQRVAEQLLLMAHGADLSSDMRDFLLRLGQRWGRVSQALEQPAQPVAQDDFSHPHAHWHHSPETLQ